MPPRKDENARVDRSKASIFQWDDSRLQKTAVVQKKLTKSATKVQRFIRACIQHWKFYNEERLPLLEDLKDIDRRRLEELEEVKKYVQRGFEEAKFELEYELAMPQEEFEKNQTETRELKKWIRDEEIAIADVEAELREEKTKQKHLERETHEIEAQHTFARLDVEIPALEEENEELSGVNAQFKGIADDLRYGRLDPLEVKIFLESCHKSRLQSTIKKIILKVESTGKVKPKVVDKLKTIFKYKGEDPPPEPSPPPSPPATPDAIGTTSDPVNGQNSTISSSDEKDPRDDDIAAETTSAEMEDEPNGLLPSTLRDNEVGPIASEPTSTSGLHLKSEINETLSKQSREEPSPEDRAVKTVTTRVRSKTKTTFDRSATDTTGARPKIKPAFARSATDEQKPRGGKKTASSSRGDEEPAAFNWGSHAQPNKRRAKPSRRSKSTDDARIPRRRGAGDSKAHREKETVAMFDWGAFSHDGKEKKSKKKSKDKEKSKEKSKKKKKSRRRSFGSAEEVSRNSRKSIAQSGHFSFAYLDVEVSDSDSD